MGRHSSPERTAFVRSLGAWALPWLLIAAVLVIALVVVFDMVGNDPVRTGADQEETQATLEDDQGSDEPEVVVSEEAEPEDDQSETDTEAEPKDDDKDSDENGSMTKDKESEDEPELITKGIQVQVLNGTADPEADDLMADRLARLGYSVVAVSPSSKGYAETIVFWTDGAERVAAPLAERFDWNSDPAPSNLSTEVQLHVVVGEDEL